MRSALILLACLLVPPATAFGQDPADPLPAHAILPSTADLPLWEVDRPALLKWNHDYPAWEEWAGEWLNKRQWALHPFPWPFWKSQAGLFSYVAERRPEPVPPDWLADTCVQSEGLLQGDDPLIQGCELLRLWRDDFPTQMIRAKLAYAARQRERSTKTKLTEHFHATIFGTNTQAQPGQRAYSMSGIHFSVPLRGRFEVALPGIMPLSLPGANQTRFITIGYHTGLSVRMFDFQFPYVGTPGRAYLDLLSVWIPEIEQRIDMVGVSLTVLKSK